MVKGTVYEPIVIIFPNALPRPSAKGKKAEQSYRTLLLSILTKMVYGYTKLHSKWPRCHLQVDQQALLKHDQEEKLTRAFFLTSFSSPSDKLPNSQTQLLLYQVTCFQAQLLLYFSHIIWFLILATSLSAKLIFLILRQGNGV